MDLNSDAKEVMWYTLNTVSLSDISTVNHGTFRLYFSTHGGKNNLHYTHLIFTAKIGVRMLVMSVVPPCAVDSKEVYDQLQYIYIIVTAHLFI